MNFLFRTCICLLMSMAFLTPARAQYRREPLNPVEIDKLRDAAQEPSQRIKLYLQFCRTRLAAIEQMRSDPNVTNRGQQTHDQLQNFLDVYDELNDNIETFVQRHADLRKPLKSVIEADNEFQAKLLALKDAAENTKEDAEQYRFLLSSVIDTVDGGLRDHRQLLSDQEEAARHKRK